MDPSAALRAAFGPLGTWSNFDGIAVADVLGFAGEGRGTRIRHAVGQRILADLATVRALAPR